MGTKHKPFYRVVATDSRRPRESRYIDLIGYYNPVRETAEIRIDLNKYNEWISKGAKPSATVKSLIKRVKTDN
jgi:small subunit ribosomal protein S16